jgi:D-alanyl-D-alanine carboxypeptidase
LECSATVKIPREAVGTEGSSVYLREGELLSVEQLLYALLLESANDAAVALAICAAGSVEQFAKRCNDKARALGLCNTNFTNPHGLYDENHYTTAYDLAILTAHALNEPTVAKICASRRAEIPFGVTADNPMGEGVRYLKNHNKMLFNYEGAIGVKTGFTKKSGRCLISAARRGGLSLIAVTLNAPDDWRDHSAMLDFGFEHFERRTIFEAGEFCYNFPLSNGQTDFVKATNLSPISILVPHNAPPHTYSVESCFRFAVAPTRKGQIIGRLCVYLDGKEYTSTLVCTEEINKISNKHSFFN